ncbi:MAG: oligosaccharide flippase family protein [Candidatus Omnitrophica bacterium]|nr:oligosaccharide flippase family protein [Candidatus Omnitrophota bacterium]
MSATNAPDIKKKIITDTVKFSGGYGLSQVIGFFTAILQRRFLGPYYMGIWSMLKVVQSYFDYLCLGVDSAAAYKIPFYRGKGDQGSSEETLDVVFGFILLVSVLSSLCLIAAAFIFRNSYPIEITVGLIVLAIYIILARIYGVYLIAIRAYKNISVLTRSVLFDAVFNLILVAIFVGRYQIYGLFAVISVMAVANTLFIHFQTGYNIRFKIRYERVKELVAYGLPLFLYSFMGCTLRSIDRIMVANMMGMTYVGFYSLANMTTNYVQGISNSFGIVTIPHMQDCYGEKENVDNIKKFVTASAEIITYLLVPLLGLIYLASPLLIKTLLPKYVPGIAVMQILLLDSLFSSACVQSQQFIVTIGKQIKLLPVFILTLVLNIVLNYAAIRTGYGIAGVALSTSISSFFYFAVVTIYAMRYFASVGYIARFFGVLMMPVICIIFVLFLLGKFLIISDQWYKFFVDSLIMMLVSLPFIWTINKKYGLIEHIFGKKKTV